MQLDPRIVQAVLQQLSAQRGSSALVPPAQNPDMSAGLPLPANPYGEAPPVAAGPGYVPSQNGLTDAMLADYRAGLLPKMGVDAPMQGDGMNVRQLQGAARALGGVPSSMYAESAEPGLGVAPAAPFALQAPTDQAAAAPPGAQLAQQQAPGVNLVPGTMQEWQRGQMALTREAIALKAEQGINEAGGLDRMADIRGTANDFNMERFQKTVAHVDAAQLKAAGFREQAVQHVTQMQAELGRAPSTTLAEVMQLIGGVMSLGRGGQGQAGGALMQGIGSIMMRPYQRWAAGVEQHGQLAKAFGQLAQNTDQGIESEIDQERKLSDLLTSNMLNALEETKLRTSSVQAQLVADEAINKIKQDIYPKHQEMLLRQTMALTDTYYKMEPDQLAAEIAAGNVGKLGQDIYNEREKEAAARMAGAVELQNKALDIEKKKQDLAGGGEGGKGYVPGLRMTAPPGSISPKETSEAQEIMDSQHRLEKIAADMKRYGAEDTPTAAAAYEGARNAFIGILNRKESDAGVLNPGERKNYDSIVPKHRLTEGKEAFRVTDDKGNFSLGQVGMIGPRLAGVAIGRGVTDENAILDSMTARGAEMTRAGLKLRKYDIDGAADAAGGPGALNVKLPNGEVKSYPDTPENRALIQQHKLQVVQ